MRTLDPRNEFAIRAEDMRAMLFPSGLDNNGVNSLLQDTIAKLLKRQASLTAMFAHFDEFGWGSTFAHDNGQYAVVLRDPSEKGAYRCQYFDKRGFFGHSTFRRADEVIVELCENRYDRAVPGDTLDSMSQTPDWILGTEALALRHAVEAGLITREEGERRYANLEASIKSSAVAA